MGEDTQILALSCLAIARHPEPDRLPPVTKTHVRQLATESRTTIVRHACTFAHAVLQPANALAELREDVEHTDPLVAAIAAWRVGNIGAPDRANVAPLLTRALGSGGLARDAASAALVLLLDTSQRSQHAQGRFAPAPRGTGWDASFERWLQQRVVPSLTPVDPSRLAARSDAIADAVDAARTGTRAQRAALQKAQARCAEPSSRTICIPAVAAGPVRIPN